jgi:multicomponent Na+:H+ antiporter subunit B
MTNDLLVLPFKIEFYTSNALLIISALTVVFAALRLAMSKNLTESIIIMSVFSIFISICYLLMDGPDVAMTETALGACLSTCVLLNLIKICGEKVGSTNKIRVILASVLCAIFILALTWASMDLPEFGKEDSAVLTHVSQYYVSNTSTDIGIPSMVAAILASYRGYDTLGETTVILIAGIAVLVILSRRKKT